MQRERYSEPSRREYFRWFVLYIILCLCVLLYRVAYPEAGDPTTDKIALLMIPPILGVLGYVGYQLRD